MAEYPYDGDTNDPSQYCEHGTWIGSWWGPDILCGLCESGIPMEELLVARVEESRARLERFISGVYASASGFYSTGMSETLQNALLECLDDLGKVKQSAEQALEAYRREHNKVT